MRAGAISVMGALMVLACSAAGSSPGDPKEPKTPGALIYKANCAMCHGRKGKLTMGGAKDLTKSTLTQEEMITVVTHGRGGMAAFEKMLSKKQIEEVVGHVRTLHEPSASAN